MQAAWLERIAPNIPSTKQQTIHEALRLHQRYRFDPDGLSAAERSRLRKLCQGLAAPA